MRRTALVKSNNPHLAGGEISISLGEREREREREERERERDIQCCFGNLEIS